MDRLGKTSAASGMEISVEKTKLMTNNTNGINIDIRINGEILDEFDSFKIKVPSPEALSRNAQTRAALARLKTIWNNKHFSLSSKIRLMRSLVISVLLYVCETWTLTEGILKKLQAPEMRFL